MNRIRLSRSYYASLCWYGLKRLGFLGQPPASGMEKWIKRLTGAGQQFGFCAPVAGGPLFRFLYQIPGYIDPASVSEAREVFRAEMDLIRSGSIKALLNGWPDQTRYWERWYHPLACEQIQMEFSSNTEAAIQLLVDWVDYLEEIWEGYRSTFEQSLCDYPFMDYENRCNHFSIFEQWDRSFGFPYPYTEFIVIVCPESASLASSLGPEKIVFGSRFDFEKLYRSAIHEIGVRYPAFDNLAENPKLASVMKSDYVGLLKLIETEVCYRKKLLFPNLGEDKFTIGMGLQDLLAWRERQELPSSYSFAESFAILYLLAQKENLLSTV